MGKNYYIAGAKRGGKTTEIEKMVKSKINGYDIESAEMDTPFDKIILKFKNGAKLFFNKASDLKSITRIVDKPILEKFGIPGITLVPEKDRKIKPVYRLAMDFADPNQQPISFLHTAYSNRLMLQKAFNESDEAIKKAMNEAIAESQERLHPLLEGVWSTVDDVLADTEEHSLDALPYNTHSTNPRRSELQQMMELQDLLNISMSFRRNKIPDIDEDILWGNLLHKLIRHDINNTPSVSAIPVSEWHFNYDFGILKIYYLPSDVRLKGELLMSNTKVPITGYDGVADVLREHGIIKKDDPRKGNPGLPDTIERPTYVYRMQDQKRGKVTIAGKSYVVDDGIIKTTDMIDYDIIENCPAYLNGLIKRFTIGVDDLSLLDGMENSAKEYVKQVIRVSAAQIHADFKNAIHQRMDNSKHLLKKYKENKPEIDKLKKLADMGFENIPAVKNQQWIMNTLEKAKTEAELVVHYMKYYPQNNFVLMDDIESLCKKYGLYCSEPKMFIGDIPDKNMQEIVNFTVRKDDLPKAGEYGYGNQGNDYLVVAPKDMFKYTPGYDRIANEFMIIDDPIVLRKVKGGYLMVSAWGDEAKLPEAQNPNRN